MSCPCLQKELCCLRVENLLLWNHLLWVHSQWCLLSQQTCMERVLGEESLAKLGIFQLLIKVLVKSLHKQCQLVYRYVQTKDPKTIPKVPETD